MASKVAQVADAVKALLDANAWTIGNPIGATFVAERVFVPEAKTEDLADLRVTVLPASIAIARESRNSHRHGYAISVAVRKRVQSEDTEELDPLLEVAELVLDTLRSNPISTADLGALSAVEVSSEPIFSVAMIQTERVFLAVCTVTYPAVRGHA